MVLVLPVLLVLPIMMMGGGGEEPAGGRGTGVTGVPAEYVDVITRAGQVCEAVTAPLLAAQIEVESGWDPRAGSPAGAQGISQFMPSTWQAVGADHNGDGVADVLDPEDSIPSQARYLCSLVETVRGWLDSGRVSGDLTELALAAYNAGSGAVLQNGGIPPFPETERYVPAVLSRVAKYTATTGSGSAGGGGGAAVVAAARAQLGIPYVWGGESDAGVDCSGLVLRAYEAVGVHLTHSSRAQYGEGAQVPLSQAQPGDLVFWSADGSQPGIYHVAMYLGDGRIIEAPTFGYTVREIAMYDTDRVMPYAVRPY